MKKCVFAIVLFLQGCATSSPLPQLEEIRQPELDASITTELGDIMVRYTIASTLPSYQLTQAFQPEFFNTKFISIGTILTPWSDTDTYESFREGLCRFKKSGKWYLGPTPLGACGYESAFLPVNEVAVSAKKAKWIDVSTRNIDQRLIYNGRVGNYVKFTYREFSASGMARMPFTQDVQYDLDKGAVIGFKGVRIEILDATNRKIQYRVLRHFRGLE
jgi:hypothetical protein